jgi:hypothetical protein
MKMSCVSGVHMSMGERTVLFTMGSKIRVMITVARMGNVHSPYMVQIYQALYADAILAGQALAVKRGHHLHAKATVSMVERARTHQIPV